MTEDTTIDTTVHPRAEPTELLEPRLVEPGVVSAPRWRPNPGRLLAGRDASHLRAVGYTQ